MRPVIVPEPFVVFVVRAVVGPVTVFHIIPLLAIAVPPFEIIFTPLIALFGVIWR